MLISTPSDQDMPRIRGPEGQVFGRELSISITDTLDQMVNEHIISCENVNRFGNAPKILDLGGATGYRAKQMSELGAEVLVIDICDNQSIIDKRNKNRGNKAPIGFIQANAVTISEQQLPKYEWSLIHARRMLHWLPWDKAEHLISSMPGLASKQTHIAMCFHHHNEQINEPDAFSVSPVNSFYRHRAEDVLKLMSKCQYEIISHGQATLASRRNYAIFARLPTQSHLKN
jgi:predicted TPR repeat methyltransferase